MIIHKCDKCGCLSEQKKGQSASPPEGWTTIRFDNGAYQVRYVYYELCPACQKALNIPDEYKKAIPSIGENLLDILSEIAKEAIQE